LVGRWVDWMRGRCESGYELVGISINEFIHFKKHNTRNQKS